MRRRSPSGGLSSVPLTSSVETPPSVSSLVSVSEHRRRSAVASRRSGRRRDRGYGSGFAACPPAPSPRRVRRGVSGTPPWVGEGDPDQAASSFVGIDSLDHTGTRPHRRTPTWSHSGVSQAQPDIRWRPSRSPSPPRVGEWRLRRTRWYRRSSIGSSSLICEVSSKVEVR